MDPIAIAARTALEKCPSTTWEAEPIGDYLGREYSFQNRKEQLVQLALKSRSKVSVLLVHWALMGQWPSTIRKQPVYFLRVILNWASQKNTYKPDTNFPASPPPWDAKFAATFLENTVDSWYSFELIALQGWASRRAMEFEPTEWPEDDHDHDQVSW